MKNNYKRRLEMRSWRTLSNVVVYALEEIGKGPAPIEDRVIQILVDAGEQNRALRHVLFAVFNTVMNRMHRQKEIEG